MSNLQQRIITGVLYGVVLIGSVFLSEYTLVGLLLLVLIISLRELHKLFARLGVYPQTWFSYSASLLLFSACIYFTLSKAMLGIEIKELLITLAVLAGMITLLFITELFRKYPRPIENIGLSILAPFYLAVPAGLLASSSITPTAEYQPWVPMFFFLFMWASDTGAYFTGRAFGKHKLFERHSPAKTIEGLAGGILAAALTGIGANAVLGGNILFWIFCGAAMAVTGTLGDLFESMFKRQADVKDSGTILPGHGGILDRFDSTFLSAPVYFILIRLFM